MVLSELAAVVKICRELVSWMDAQEEKQNRQLSDVPEIDIMEARSKIKRLKKAINSIDK